MISLNRVLIILLILVISLIVHECAHAGMSFVFGDKQALKRMFASPMNYLDILGLVMMVFFGFGWAKPVQVDASCYRHPKMALSYVALVAPLSNFILGFMAVVLYALTHMEWLALVAQLNVGLAVFNLLPIPFWMDQKFGLRFCQTIYIIVSFNLL